MAFRGARPWLGAFLILPALAIAAEPVSTVRVRRPEALAVVDGGARLLTANHASGTISIVDLASRSVAAEAEIGKGLADLKELPGGRWLLAVDQAAGELVLVEHAGESIRRASATPVAADPARVVLAADGRRAVVVSRWSRTLTFLDVKREEDRPAAPPVIHARATLALPFCPLDAAVVPGGSPALLAVADAFGGRLALIDLDKPAVVSSWPLPAHNLRSLQFSADGRTLGMLDQVVNPLNRTSADDIHWGLLAYSEVRTLPLDDLRTPGVDVATLLENGRTAKIGNIGRGSADPSSFAFQPDGALVVAAAGADEVAASLGIGRPYRRFHVGRRPVALALSPDGKTAYTADSLDDAVSVVNLSGAARAEAMYSADSLDEANSDVKPSGTARAESIILGPRPAATLAEEGERLFTTAAIGREGWMSCHSCHTDGHTSGALADTPSDGSYGAAKQTPSLLGVGRTAPWTWLGRVDRLEDQVRRSITSTMRGGDPTDRQVDALTAFLRTLEPPRLEAAAAPEAVARGRAVFASHDCASCHAGPEYTSPKTYEIGLTDAVGTRAFNPPSLRAVSRRSSYLHDASAHSLPDLFNRVQHPDGGSLSPGEISDLVAFLESL